MECASKICEVTDSADCFATGISLFEVDHKDHVRKYNDVDAFTLFKYHSHIEGQPPAFLQCGGFVYPLVPGKSPILKSGDRMYMFPQLKSEGATWCERRGGGVCAVTFCFSFNIDGSSVGVALESASQAEIEELDRLLSQLADLKTVEEVAEGVGERSQVGVAKGEDPKWGSSVAGVCFEVGVWKGCFSIFASLFILRASTKESAGSRPRLPKEQKWLETLL